MRDGRTRKISGPMDVAATASFLDRHEVSLVVLSGRGAGGEVTVERSPTTLGRGPGVDLAFDDPAMSRQHVAFEVSGSHLRVRDLGSTNGMRVNGSATAAADLKHGDRLEIGGHRFQLVVAPRRKVERAYVLPDD
jgi:pSer/pThr/pTyr-binding forkhead associated (FHA) protein